MSADIINLRQARKSRARREKEEQASQNRVQFGRSKAEKQLTALNRDKDQRHLDAHRRDKPHATDPQEDNKDS